MNAKEARNLTEKNQLVGLDKIFMYIKDATSRGHYTVILDNSSQMTAPIKEELERLGYTIISAATDDGFVPAITW